MMKNNVVCAVVLSGALLFWLQDGALYAQEAIDSAELQKAAGPVEFISNTAVPDRIDTREQIVELGRGPGAAVRNGAATFGALSRYFVIHRLHPPEFDKLDADIFGLGSGTAVDTIGNLRFIIQGYLQTAYAYSPADAVLLAEYITIYNAVYRQNRPYFEQRYKSPLLNDLTAGREGIALNYREWPGQTLMVIPLMTAAPGSLSAIDTSAITDAAVIEKMREEADRGISSRQDMVELKEREADAAEKTALAQRQSNAAEEQRIAEESRRVAAEEQRIAAEKAQLEQQKAQAATSQQKAELAQREEELKKDEAELASRQEDLGEASAELAAAQEQARSMEDFAERKSEEAQQERETIAADQRQIIAGAVEAVPPPPSGVVAVRLSSSANPRGTVVKVNPASGMTLQSSAVNQASARTLTMLGGKTLVVATSGGKTRLVEVDPSTLQVIKQGEDELNGDTQIWVSGANLYAIAVQGGKNYLARFDVNLAKQSQSTLIVHQWAAVSFQGDKIITQNDKGAIILLNATTLTE